MFCEMLGLRAFHTAKPSKDKAGEFCGDWRPAGHVYHASMKFMVKINHTVHKQIYKDVA